MAKKATHLTKIKYELSEDLADFMGKDYASRPEVTKEIWAYIKKNELNNGRTINPKGSDLEDLFGKASFDMLKLATKLKPHFGERAS